MTTKMLCQKVLKTPMPRREQKLCCEPGLAAPLYVKALRRKTTVSKRLPGDLIPKIIQYIITVRIGSVDDRCSSLARYACSA